MKKMSKSYFFLSCPAFTVTLPPQPLSGRTCGGALFCGFPMPILFISVLQSVYMDEDFFSFHILIKNINPSPIEI